MNRFEPAEIAALASEVHEVEYTRDDVRGFFGRGQKEHGKADGKRGARTFDWIETAAAVALIPWNASLGGPEGRNAWYCHAQNSLSTGHLVGESEVVAEEIKRPLFLLIRPGLHPFKTNGTGAANRCTMASDIRAGQLHPSTIVVDLRRIANFVLSRATNLWQA